MTENTATYKIDLHVHSNHSDGTYSPSELVSLAKRKNIKLFAVTDHDTVSGVKEAKASASKLDIACISGIEFSAAFEAGTLHILGYGIDTQSPILLTAIEKQQKNRVTRNKRIIDKLGDLGIDLSDQKELSSSSGNNHSLGRPHIAYALIKKNIVKTIDAAFNEYLGKEGTAYVEKELLSPKEILRIIRQSGGVSFIAHPITLNLDESAFQSFAAELKQLGLNGIEVYSSSHGKKQIGMFKTACAEKGLLISGGSDFHGNNKKGVKMGICNAGKPIKSSMVSEDLLRIIT